MSSGANLGTAVVTGASSGIGRLYAERLAARGYDLVLVARNAQRLDALASEIRAATGRAVDPLPADLEKPDDVRRVADRIAGDPKVTLLVNNAGAGTEGPVLGTDVDRVEAMVQLNVVALTRLAISAVNAFAARGGGTLVNIASVVALMPEVLLGAYAGTKAYVLAFTQSLQNELRDGPVRVQAVLPGVTRTEFFDRAGLALDSYPPEMVMSVEELVDAALAGLDAGEAITIPSLPDASDFARITDDRLALVPNLSRNHPAERYRV